MSDHGRYAAAFIVAVVMLLAGSFVARAAPVPKVLVFGDSLMAGLGLDQDQGFVARLQQALDKAGVAAHLVNASASGDTTATGLARLDWALGDGPDAVILELGANDMLQGLPVADARANLNAMLTRIGALKLPVLLVGMKANRSLGADYVQAFDAMYPALAEQHHVLFYPFFLDGVALDPKLNQADLMHPNAQGVDAIVARILPLVEKLVAEASN